MRTTITPAMAAFLQSDARTLAACVLVTRQDGQSFGFTEHDVDINYGGLVYESSIGITASAIENTGDMSTSNMELNGLLVSPTATLTQSDIEGGVWSGAAFTIFYVNYADLTMGGALLVGGLLGEFNLANGNWKVELRGLSQVIQQSACEQFSQGCRAKLGDARCTLSLVDKSFNGAVGAVTVPGIAWTDASLTQTGPALPYVDTTGHRLPTFGPYQVQISPPDGSYQGPVSVLDVAGNGFTQVAGSPGDRQYTVTGAGLYTFNVNQAGSFVYINYTYAVGYFAFGFVKWTSGANAGLSSEVRTFSPGVVTLGLPMPHAIAPSDAYVIVAGCDKQMGTCRDRWNNLLNFRGEPYIPGPDALLRPQK